MTTIDDRTTLGELVNAYPQLARELERLGLDYCCRGGRTLAEACDAAGLDPTRAVAELTALIRRPAAVQDWTTMTAAELVDHIVSTHHRYLWAELPRLTELVEKVVRCTARPTRSCTRSTAVFDDLRTDLEPHMLKEERVLFPMIRELSVATGAAELPLRNREEPDLRHARRARPCRGAPRTAAGADPGVRSARRRVCLLRSVLPRAR